MNKIITVIVVIAVLIGFYFLIKNLIKKNPQPPIPPEPIPPEPIPPEPEKRFELLKSGNYKLFTSPRLQMNIDCGYNQQGDTYYVCSLAQTQLASNKMVHPIYFNSDNKTITINVNGEIYYLSNMPLGTNNISWIHIKFQDDRLDRFIQGIALAMSIRDNKIFIIKIKENGEQEYLYELDRVENI